MSTKLSSVKLAALIVAGLLLFPLLLFLPAGTLNWPEAWLASIFFGVYMVTTTLWLNKNNPDLLRERMYSKKSIKGWKGWDKVLMIALSIPALLLFPIIAFDAVRFQWSQVPLFLKALGFLGMIPFLVLTFLVMKENTYAAKIVRIQKDRGHKVVTTGPYSIVRHPMYVGAILLFICLPLALGSFYAIIPGTLVSILFIIRTYLEDKTLQKELKGYKEYTKKVKYRLLPGIW